MTEEGQSTTPETPAAEPGEAGAERERGRRRGRGGRDRDRDGPREPRADRGVEGSEAGGLGEAAATVSVAAAAPGAAVANMVDAASLPAGQPAEADEGAAPVVETAAIPAMPVASPPAPAPAARAAEPAAAPVQAAVPYHLPTDSLNALAASAGLQWVQSDADRISAVQAAMAAEPAPVRAPREPRRQVLVDDGPLVLVETRKDLSQLKLPFEQQAAG